MGSIIRKVFAYLLLPAAIAGLTYALVKSIMEPVEFNKYKDYRTEIAVQRLKDIRDLQVAFKNVNARYSPTVDSLIWFYNEGKMTITLQVGSKDDSLAMANTERSRSSTATSRATNSTRSFMSFILPASRTSCSR